MKRNEVFTEVVLEIFRVGGFLNTEGDRLTKEFGLTASRWKILGAVKLSDAPITVPDIARYMGLSRQAVQRLVDVMVGDGLLELSDNPNHKRAKYVHLTEKAGKTYARIESKQDQWATERTASMSKAELELTLDVLRRIPD